MSKAALRIAIADDHAIALSGLELLVKSVAGFEICGKARSVAEIESVLLREKPDVLVTDLILGREESGANLTRWRREFPATKFVIVTMIVDASVARNLLEKGADGFVSKGDDPGEILEAIHTVSRGGKYVGQTIRDFWQANQESVDTSSLSERERQVFRLVGEGLSNKEISRQLFLSIKTVETHKEHIKNKLHVHTMPELLAEARKWCIQSGLKSSQ